MWRPSRPSGLRRKARVANLDLVLVLVRYSGRGTTSVMAQEMEGALLFHVHERVVTKVVIHLERDRALADLGLKD